MNVHAWKAAESYVRKDAGLAMRLLDKVMQEVMGFETLLEM